MTSTGLRWALDGRLLPEGLTLDFLLSLRQEAMTDLLRVLPKEDGDGSAVSPIEEDQEVWAAGVTYLRSRVEREAESTVADVYARVYEADRPEIFFKSIGWRVVGPEEPVRIRKDSNWNVPEPELTLVVNRYGEIVGYTAGNDMSSRAIEGANPLYLPQAKTYDGSCALGPAIVLNAHPADIPISLVIMRKNEIVFSGDTNTSQMKRSFEDLVSFLFRETTFPTGVFLMTGTGIVPAHPFTLKRGDVVQVTVGELTLVNKVSRT